MNTLFPIIEGKTVSQEEFTFVENPYNHKNVTKLFFSTRKNIKRCLDSSYICELEWEERLDIIKKMGKKLKSNKYDLSRKTTLENGSPISFTEDQVDEASYFAKNIDKLDVELKGKYLLEPKGTIFFGVPFNEPIMVSVNALLPAILFGNKVIVKPSESAPSASYYIVKFLIDIGWPVEGISYLPVQRKDTEYLISHENLNLVFWTGGSKSAKIIGSLALKYGKEFTPESEGNDWAIVDDSCNIKKVSDIIFKAFTTNNGEMCNAIRGVIAKENIYEELIEFLVKRLEKISMGNPLKKNMDIGPLKNSNIVSDLVGKILETRSETYGLQYHNNFFHPTVVLNPPWNSRLVKEESFGPVLWATPIKDVKLSVEYYNKLNKHNLCVSVFSRNRKLIEFIKKNANCTIVHINRNPIEVSPFLPWGGRGLSGFGGAKSWPNKFLDNKYVIEEEDFE